jgi:CheY-like chemotaxis protein
LRSKRILMIDDEYAFCLMMRNMIQEIGPYKVIVATNGFQGIKAAAREKPDMILLDIAMPSIDGFDVLNILRHKKATKYIPVIMVTGLDSTDMIQSAISQFAEQYLIKPVSLENLKLAIDRTLKFH